MRKLKKRQLLILDALTDLGEKATTRNIAEKTGLNVNGVSQSLGALSDFVKMNGGKGGDSEWEMIEKMSPDEKALRRAYKLEPHPKFVMKKGRRIRLSKISR
jgi:hypothetical protein